MEDSFLDSTCLKKTTYGSLQEVLKQDADTIMTYCVYSQRCVFDAKLILKNKKDKNDPES